MLSERRLSRCKERLESLGASALDRESLQLEAIAELRAAIGFDRWCWPLGDPESLVPLSGVAEHDYGPRLPRALPVGIGDEAILACRDGLGCWGWIKAYRDSDQERFSERDLDLLAQVGPLLGSALRRRIGPAQGQDQGPPSSPGMLVLDDQLQVVDWTAGAQAWIDTLPGAALFAHWGMLPAVLYPVAAQARATPAHALERGVDGRWLKIEAARLEGYDAGRTAVVLRAAAPAETFDMLSRAYALTPRERELVAALVAGLDTRAVTERLFISRHTVQDHLKSVFRKVGVRTRRELIATFAHSYPK